MNTTIPQPVPLSPSTEHYYDGWCKRVRDILLRDNLPVRMSPTGLAIEINNGQGFGPVMLPNNGYHFASEADRQVIFEMVTGVREIPEAAPKEEAT